MTGEEVVMEPSSRDTARIEGVHPRLVNKVQLNNENMIPDMVASQLGWKGTLELRNKRGGTG